MKKLLATTLAAFIAAFTISLTPAMAEGDAATTTVTATATTTSTSTTTSTGTGNSANAPWLNGWWILSSTGLALIFFILWGFARPREERKVRMFVCAGLGLLGAGILRHLKLQSPKTAIILGAVALTPYIITGHWRGLWRALHGGKNPKVRKDLSYCPKCGHRTPGKSFCGQCGEAKGDLSLDF